MVTFVEVCGNYGLAPNSRTGVDPIVQLLSVLGPGGLVDWVVLIRYLVRDDQPQYERARRLLRRAVQSGEPVMVSLLTLLEMEWVLRSRYASSKEDIAATISSLLDTAELTFEDEPSIEEAIHLWRGSATGFADCLINARNRRLGCRTTATFDREALQLTGFSQV